MSASWTRQNRSPWIALLNLASIPSGEQSVVLNWPAVGQVAQPTRTASARPPAIKIFGDRICHVTAVPPSKLPPLVWPCRSSLVVGSAFQARGLDRKALLLHCCVRQ